MTFFDYISRFLHFFGLKSDEIHTCGSCRNYCELCGKSCGFCAEGGSVYLARRGRYPTTHRARRACRAWAAYQPETGTL